MFDLNDSSASTSEPGLCGTLNIIAVLSLPVRGGFLLADDGEARLVVRIVLDVGEQDPQAVLHRRLPTRDRRRPGSCWRELGGDRGARDVLQIGVRQVLLSQLRHCASACGFE